MKKNVEDLLKWAGVRAWAVIFCQKLIFVEGFSMKTASAKCKSMPPPLVESCKSCPYSGVLGVPVLEIGKKREIQVGTLLTLCIQGLELIN